MINRRAFLWTVIAAATVQPGRDSGPYSEAFFAKVWSRVTSIVVEQRRGVHRIVIDPPRGNTRLVRLRLNAGPSLLDRIYYEWSESFCV